jgi:hypothetical protein
MMSVPGMEFHSARPKRGDSPGHRGMSGACVK